MTTVPKEQRKLHITRDTAMHPTGRAALHHGENISVLRHTSKVSEMEGSHQSRNKYCNK